MNPLEQLRKEVREEFLTHSRTSEEWNGEYMSNDKTLAFIDSIIDKTIELCEREVVPEKPGTDWTHTLTKAAFEACRHRVITAFSNLKHHD